MLSINRPPFRVAALALPFLASLTIGTAPPAAAQQPLSVTTRLIETKVIVRDKNGPVADLNQDDFKIFDNGKPQKIAVFHLSKAETQRASSGPALPANVFSNRAGQTSRSPRHTVLLIDTMNTDTADRAYVKTQVRTLLDSLEIKDPIAIDVLGQKFRLLQDFTLDRAALIKAIDGFQPESSQKLRMATTPAPAMPGAERHDPTAVAIRQGYAQMHGFANRDRGLATIDFLAALAKQLGPLPGEKSVIWISSAFPILALNHDTESVQALDRADVTIYSVDAVGLKPPGGPPDYPETLTWIAEETGGRAFYNRNDFTNEIQEAMNDNDVTYTLGFYAPENKADGNFHTLKVEVDRKGLDVRHRKGYFDVEPKPADLTSLNPGTVPENASEIGLIAAIARAGANFQVAVQIGFNDLRLTPENNRWKGSAKLTLVAQSAEGAVVDVKSKTLTFDMPGDAYLKRQREGIVIEQTIPANQKTAKIRVVIVDKSGGSGEVSITPPK